MTAVLSQPSKGLALSARASVWFTMMMLPMSGHRASWQHMRYMQSVGKLPVGLLSTESHQDWLPDLIDPRIISQAWLSV